ncbi:MAG TPA: hypothetical protein VM695_04130, partial [Phycisphaerae bacterium]|nr:hypothetical protein [Phycisphaerae bacterium]
MCGPRERMLRSCGCVVLSVAMAWASAGAAPLPEPGGLVALPQLEERPVRLVNPGFEAGDEGWRLGKPPFQVVPAATPEGKACLQFDAAAPFPYTPSARQVVAEMAPGIYVLRFRVKAEGIQPPARGSGGLRVSLEYQRRGGEHARAATEIFGGTFDWRAEELRCLLPADAKPGSTAISIHRYGTPAGGKGLVDDVALARLQPPPVEAFLRYPNWRGYLAPDAPQQVRVWLKV